jgi:hypothetical protein
MLLRSLPNNPKLLACLATKVIVNKWAGKILLLLIDFNVLIVIQKAKSIPALMR